MVARASPGAPNRGRLSPGHSPPSSAAAAPMPASADAPPIAIAVRRVRASIALPPSSFRQSRSWRGPAVTDGGNVVEHHHLMVLVDGVVTVERIAADHVTEPDEQLDRVAEAHLHDVLCGRTRCHPASS